VPGRSPAEPGYRNGPYGFRCAGEGDMPTSSPISIQPLKRQHSAVSNQQSAAELPRKTKLTKEPKFGKPRSLGQALGGEW
jgi:hypothetical protein